VSYLLLDAPVNWCCLVYRILASHVTLLGVSSSQDFRASEPANQ